MFQLAIFEFLNFRLANKKLQDSLTYRNCQRNLLITEINLKKSRLRVLKKEFYLLHSEFKSVSNYIDFAHVCSLFLSSNDVILQSHDSIQQKSLTFLLKIPSQNITQMKLFLTILKFLYLIWKSHYQLEDFGFHYHLRSLIMLII